MGVLGTFSRLAGEVPDSIDSDDAELILLGLIALCLIGVVIVVRTVAKTTTRFLLVGLLVAAGIGLWFQHDQLQDCSGQCTCHLFGRDVNVPDPTGDCPS